MHHVAAVDVDRLARDLSGKRRRKKDDHRRDVLRCLPIPKRYELLDLPRRPVLIVEPLGRLGSLKPSLPNRPIEPRGHHSRTNRVDPHLL